MHIGCIEDLGSIKAIVFFNVSDFDSSCRHSKNLGGCLLNVFITRGSNPHFLSNYGSE